MTKIGSKLHHQRRRRTTTRLVSILVISSSFLLLVTLSNFGPPAINENENHNHVSNQRDNLLILNNGLRQPRHTKPDKRKKKEQDDDNALLDMRRVLVDEFNDDNQTTLREAALSILTASVQLVDIATVHGYTIHDDSYTGIIAEFCTVNFSTQKDDPPSHPMFRDVVSQSPACTDRIRVDFASAVALVREYDDSSSSTSGRKDEDEVKPTILNLRGVVFHESRCGSTLAANTMVALDPTSNRVYSESGPPATAMRICGEDYSDCTREASAYLLQDVVYLMSRSNDDKEENLFFKFQSVTSRTMESFRIAFPTTPWIFLYRKPIEVMMSQLNVPQTSMANCVRSKKNSPMVKSFVMKINGNIYKPNSDEEYCAVHLATICQSALWNLIDADGLGVAVEYNPNLVDDFLGTIFPKHFHIPVDDEANKRVLAIAGTYSKNRGGGKRVKQKGGKFVPDGDEKERKASDEMKEAAALFLLPTFEQLTETKYNIRSVEETD